MRLTGCRDATSVPSMLQLDLYDAEDSEDVLAVPRGTVLAKVPGLPGGRWTWVGSMTVDAVAGLLGPGADEIADEVNRQGYCLWA
jgi:hypothetical protein